MSDGQVAYNEMSDSEKKKEDWMNSKWRPAMGWLYMLVCFCDFVVFPVLWAILHAIMHSTNVQQWQPLTLQGAGLFHLAMGAVLGLAAWGRTQEKLGGANNGGISLPSSGGSSFGAAPASGFGAPAPTSFGASSTPSSFGGGSFGSTPKPAAPAPTFSAPATASVGFSSSGKAMPMQPDQPEI